MFNSHEMGESPPPLKVVLLGQTCVGKSSLVLRFVQDKFFPNTEGTIGAAFLTKTLSLEDKTTSIKFEIWDTAGQERYHSLAPMYYRGAQAAIVVYDITSRDSFDKAKTWVTELRSKSTPEQMIVLVGNKSDLSAERMVETSQAQSYANENGLIQLETSAKSGTGVYSAFEIIAEKVAPRIVVTPTKPTARVDVAYQDSSGCKC